LDGVCSTGTADQPKIIATKIAKKRRRKLSNRQFETSYFLRSLRSFAAIFLLAVFPVGCPTEIRRYRDYLIPPVLSDARAAAATLWRALGISVGKRRTSSRDVGLAQSGARPYRFFAAAIKSRSLFRSFFPGLDSTPEATSTAYGSTVRIALAIFSEVSPPARMTGLAIRRP
jgi:hypothetical protein